mmetsp:Transcript_15924/g.19165  ORF Transcript_15924/g.19165 Transcript_15924/m.19165 type:complete len:316 (-) Transcript_15924:1916-2863(-)
MIRSVPVGLLPFHDLAHTLPCLRTRFVVFQALLAHFLCQIELATLNVDIGQQQPALLKVISLFCVILHLSDSLQLVSGLGGLLQHCKCRCHGQQHRHAVSVGVRKLHQFVESSLNVVLLLSGHESIAFQDVMLHRFGMKSDLLQKLFRRLHSLRVVHWSPIRQRLVPHGFIIWVEIYLHHIVDASCAPFPIFAPHVQLPQCLVRVIAIPGVQPLAEVQSSVHGSTGGGLLCHSKVPGDLAQSPGPPQKLHQLRQGHIVTRLPLQQLLKMIYRSFVMLLSEHQLRQHHTCFLLVRVRPQKRHTQLLALVGLPSRQV